MTEPSKDQLNDPNFGLAAESLVELNNDFYRLEPWVYFRFRLRNLALSAGREQQAFVVLEAEVLLHHVAETLMRLYIAHESDPDCPWIAIASERDFGRFKGKVSDLKQNLQTPGYRDRAAKVFFGRRSPFNG